MRLGDFEFEFLVAGDQLVDERQLLLSEPDAARIRPFRSFLHLGIGLIALGAPGVADDKNQFARFGPLGGNLQPVLRLVGDIVFGVGDGFSVLADIGAQVAPVAGVTRPAPVIGFAAENPDPFGGRIHEPDILDVELGDFKIFQSFEKGRHIAAQTVFFAGRDPLFDAAVDDVVALPVGRLGDRCCQ